jgi:MHS family proline/betaine transporter-like MFS transporter
VFPAEVRFAGSSLGWNLGAILGSGLAAIVAGLLVQETGSSSAPVVLVFAATLIGLAALPTVRSLRITQPAAVDVEQRPESVDS